MNAISEILAYWLSTARGALLGLLIQNLVSLPMLNIQDCCITPEFNETFNSECIGFKPFTIVLVVIM